MFSKIFQFSLFQCLKNMLLSFYHFNFKFILPWESNFPFFRAKISGFAFPPTSKRSLQVCVVHIPFPRAARKGQSPMTLYCNCTGAMQRGRQQKTPICAGKKEDSWTFFCQSRRAFLKALLLCLFGGERQDSVVRPFLASPPLSIVKIEVSEISKQPTGLPHPEKWQPWSLKMLSNKKEVLWAATHSGVQTAAAGNNTQYPNRTIVLAPNIVVFFFDQYANTLLGSCNGLRSYQATSCGCQGSVFFWNGL